MNTSKSESELFPSTTNWENLAKYGNFLLLHSGSYANTYRAQKAGKYFLLKAPKSDNTAYLNILKREYEVSVGIDHPNITSAFTIEHIPELGLCLVMEYVDGENLSEYLSHNPGTKSKKKVLSQLLSAVGYLHRRNIIHNDLKPENIIISRQDGNLKLIDFGLCDDDVHYLAKTLGCTPSFASPELLSGEKAIDARSDVYSIGKLIKLLFPIRYSLIWHKCVRNNPSARFESTEAISNAIRCRQAINYVFPLLAVLIAAAYATLPNELNDRIIRRDGIQKLDSLYVSYANLIGNEPYRLFGMFDVARFSKEYNELRDAQILLFTKDYHKDEFYSFCKKRWEEYNTLLYGIVDTRPDFGNLPYEEIKFYTDLALSGQPYRPYKK